MGLLERVYFGNALQNWLIAALIFVAFFALLKLIQNVVIHRLEKLAQATDNQIDDLIISMLKQTKFLILIVASAYVASQAVTLKPSLAAFWHKIVILMLIIQGGLWASAGITFGLKRTLAKRMDQDASSATTVGLLSLAARVILWIIVFLLILDNLGVNITGLVAGLGIGGIAVALAVQNILGDLLASLSIVLDKPFVVGDTIVVDRLTGTVEHVGLKTTRLRSVDGEELIFSNNDLLKSRIHNYKRMQERRVVLAFGVTYQTLPAKLMRVNEIVQSAVEAQPSVRFDRVHFKEYGDSALNFEAVYFMTDPDFKLYMDVQQAINVDIFRRFQEEGIEFAYPTQTVYVQNS